MAKLNFNPDQVGRDQPAYWAAVLAHAVEARDAARADAARAELRRLHCNLGWRARRKPTAEGRP